MKWLYSVQKATQRFLISKRYHRNRFFHGSLKPDPLPSSSLYSGLYYSTSTILNATESSCCRLAFQLRLFCCLNKYSNYTCISCTCIRCAL
ncbi:hypothetical protein Hanom_Chr01g00041781 [Helianthus anomalus]